MQSTSNRRLQIVIGTLVVLMLIIFIVVDLLRPKKPDLTGEYKDTNSGTVISNPAGKQPDNFGSEYPDTTFIGFDQLLSSGLGSDQLDLVKKGLNDFNVSINKKYSELSLTSDSVETTVGDSFGMDFDCIADRTVKLHTRLTYTDINAITLQVQDNSGKELYSGEYISADTEDDL